MTNILVVDDDPIIRQTVGYSLKRAGFSVSTADDGAAALRAAAEIPTDLVLLDVLLPGMDGYAVAQKLRERDDRTAIIMVSALGMERDKVRGLDAGADDYVTKPFSTDELLARVRANLRRVCPGDPRLDDRRRCVGDLVIEPASFRASVAGRRVRLRLKEFELLRTLVEHEGELLTRAFLASDVWGYVYLPTSRTIDVHIRRLRQTVDDVSDFTYIHTIHGMGYRFEPVPKSRKASAATGTPSARGLAAR